MLQKPRLRTVQLDPTTTLAYEDSSGEGPVVLMLPAEGDLRQEYRLVAPLLREDGYRVLVQDLRGLGDSSPSAGPFDIPTLARDVLAVLDDAKVERATLVGCSRSAAIVAWVAVHAPERVDNLVLISPVLREVEPSRWHRWLQRAQWSRPHGAWLWSHAYARQMAAAPPTDLGEYRAQLAIHAQQPHRLAAIRALHHLPLGDAWELLPRITQPTLVVVGGHDRLIPTPRETAETIRGCLGGTARSFVFHGLGHYPHVERPHLTTLRIVGFWRSMRRALIKADPRPAPVRAGE